MSLQDQSAYLGFLSQSLFIAIYAETEFSLRLSSF